MKRFTFQTTREIEVEAETEEEAYALVNSELHHGEEIMHDPKVEEIKKGKTGWADPYGWVRF